MGTKKYNIGYTTGVFDLFHVGHLNILEKSKELCNYLIVGVSTDELVLSYKGKTPVIPLGQRMRIVNAIEHVDEVVVQTTMDKLKAWEKHKFEVMFHGDDWKTSALYQEYESNFKKIGVDLVFFPYTKETSSTKLQKIIV
ncbi:glycerol-3-phosphate cytidylyltransferase [Bacillus freudenreichii]|nr:glycerol-3-phosphate cytidylyltransferase [Bacillus freudenreichii]